MKSLPFNGRHAAIASAIIFAFYYFQPFNGFFSSLVKSIIWGVIIVASYGLISKKRQQNKQSGSQPVGSDRDNSIRRTLSDKSCDMGERGAAACNVILFALISMGKAADTPEESNALMDLMIKVVEDGEEHPLIARLKSHPDFSVPGSLLNEALNVFNEIQKNLIDTKKRNLAILLDPNADFGRKGEIAVNVVLGALVSMGKAKEHSAEEKKAVRDMFMKLPSDGQEHPLIQLLKNHPDFNRPNTLLYGSLRVLEETQQKLAPTFKQEMLGAAFAFTNVLVELGHEENNDEGRLRTLDLMQKKFDKDGEHPLVNMVKAHPSFTQEGSYLNNAMKVFLKVQWALMDENEMKV